MNQLAYSLLLVLGGWLLRGVVSGRWRRNPKYHRLSDVRHRWVEIGGVWHAFTDDALDVAKARADGLAPLLPHRWRSRILWVVLAGGLLFLLGGCSRNPSIKTGDTTVTGPRDAGQPAKVNTAKTGETVTLPEGSTIKVTTTEAAPAQPAAPATDENPAMPAQPATPKVTVTEIVPAGPVEWQRTETTVQADTGTVDTSVARHRIEVAERRWLLWAAIGCGVGGIIIRSMLPAWPALSNGLLLAAVLAGLAWKLADIPSWIWLLALGAVALLILGYKRAEWDKDGDGVPDLLQRQRPSPAAVAPSSTTDTNPQPTGK